MRSSMSEEAKIRRGCIFLGLTVVLIALAKSVLAADTKIQTDNTQFGRPNANNKDLIFNINLGGSNPRIRANGITGHVQFSNDGTTFNDISSLTSAAPIFSVLWTSTGASPPVEDIEFSQGVFLFVPSITQELRTRVPVPNSYSPGNQLNLRLRCYSPSTTNNFLIRSTAYLIRKDITAAGATGLSRVSTNSAQSNGSPANVMRTISLDLSDTAGKIGGTSIAPGDTIEVSVARGTDTDTANVRVSSVGSEVEFQ